MEDATSTNLPIKRKRKRVRTKKTKMVVLEKVEKLFFNKSNKEIAALTGYGAPPATIVDESPQQFDTARVLSYLDLTSECTKLGGLRRLAAVFQSSTVIQTNEGAQKIWKRNQTTSEKNARAVFVDKLPPSANKTAIEKHFSNYGTVLRVDTGRPNTHRGFCFVHFASPSAAASAATSTQPTTEKMQSGSETPDKKVEVEVVAAEQEKEGATTSLDDVAPRKTRRKKRTQKHQKRIAGAPKKTLQTADLLIMSKDKWKCLRDEYLAMQKEGCSAFKKQLAPSTRPLFSKSGVWSKPLKRGRDKLNFLSANTETTATALPQPMETCDME